MLPDLAIKLEQAFEESRETWWDLCRALGANPTAAVAQAPTGAFGSDFGVMLAWSRLASGLAASHTTYLCVCDDPWLFRHLAALHGVRAGSPPALLSHQVRLAARGWIARIAVASRAAYFSFALASTRSANPRACATLLVYGHPGSDAQGRDAYFADLMQRIGELRRTLHTDCPAGRARELAADLRTASLHGWGSALFALMKLPFTRWRPGTPELHGTYGWLIRRAAARENGGGGPAMNRWQQHCQANWLADVRPRTVAWPWENHGWERHLCRIARSLDVRTVGYQHTVVGPHQINYSPHSNTDGCDSLPEVVVSDGPAYHAELAAWGVPADRLVMGGALRFSRFEADLYDPTAPIFVPLSGTTEAAERQLAAARRLADAGRSVLVKSHPLYPRDFPESERIRRTDVPLTRQPRLSAVLYSNGTSGLEGLLAGLPTFRLLLQDRVAINILPPFANAIPVELDTVVEAVAKTSRPAPLAWDQVLAVPDYSLWERMLRSKPGWQKAPDCATRGHDDGR